MSRVAISLGLFWTAFCIFVGFLLAPQVLPERPPHTLPQVMQSHAGLHDPDRHGHALRDLPEDEAPGLNMRVERDILDGWNVYLEVTRFRFAPDHVNGPPVSGEGHAHLFINGQKIARLYGPVYHIPDLPPGTHVVTVELNGNDHARLSVAGTPIADSQIITQADPGT